MLLTSLLIAAHFDIDARVLLKRSVRPDAEACVVHLHGNEIPAREVMLSLVGSTCTNAIWFDDAETGDPWPRERIPVPMTTGECSVNPNRVLTNAGYESRLDWDCGNDPVARKELRRFLDEVLLPAINECRGGGLPLVTFHNNSILTVKDFDTRATFVVDKKSHDLFFVTKEEDMARLASKKKWNIALQSLPPSDDGSLSVLLANDRYINVEAHIAPKNKRNNAKMGEWALRSVGGFVCGAGDWPEPKPRSRPQSKRQANRQ